MKAQSHRHRNSEGSDLSRLIASAGKVRLLSAEQEKTLAYTIRRGSQPEASPQELIAAEHARDQFLTANIRLSVSIARRYLWSQEPLLDLVQEGNIGLITAIRKFDPDRGYKFSTYATSWIRQAIQRYIHDKCDTIRIPVHMNEKVQKYRATFTRLQKELGSDPNLEEIARAMELPLKKVAQIREASNLTPISLQTPTNAEEPNATLGDFVADPDTKQADQTCADNQRDRIVQEALSCLNANERQVITMRFGFDGEGEHTLEQIGRRLKLSRERVRQIQVSATEKLSRRKALAALLRA